MNRHSLINITFTLLPKLSCYNGDANLNIKCCTIYLLEITRENFYDSVKKLTGIFSIDSWRAICAISVIQSKDDDEKERDVRRTWRIVKASLRKTRRDIKGAVVVVNSTCTFSIRFPPSSPPPSSSRPPRNERVPLILECIAQYARGTEFADIDEALTSSCHVLSRYNFFGQRNGSFERRVASSTCRLWWTRREYSYLTANLHAFRLYEKYSI